MSEVELAPYEVLAKEILKRVLSDEDVTELRQWLQEAIIRLGGSAEDDALMTWEESFDFTDKMIEEYERIARLPKGEQKILDFPWTSWNKLIDPLEPGIMMTVTAPDGTGKTIYSESVAEHWAKNKNKVTFVHYELNKKIMMQRRIARHCWITLRAIKGGNLTPQEKEIITEMRPALKKWEGNISYLHTPGWTIDKTLDELRKIQAERGLDVVVIDYLEKIAVSTRQMRMFGTNIYQREADNVEQLKNFAESTGIPVLMVTQLNKQGKRAEWNERNSTDISGSAEKANKSNVIVILDRDKQDDGTYSDIVQGIVSKNNQGALGSFKQLMEPQFFRVGDIDDIQEVKS